jgi:hypothetical protein
MEVSPLSLYTLPTHYSEARKNLANVTLTPPPKNIQRRMERSDPRARAAAHRLRLCVLTH